MSSLNYSLSNHLLTAYCVLVSGLPRWVYLVSLPLGSPTNTDKGFKRGTKQGVANWQARGAFQRWWHILRSLLGEFVWPERCCGSNAMLSGMCGVFSWCIIPTLASPAPRGTQGGAPQPSGGWSQYEVVLGCQHSFGGCQILWMLSVCESSPDLRLVVDQFTAAGGRGNCLLRFVQGQAGSTQGPQTSCSWISEIPSHPGKSTLLRRGRDGTGGGWPALVGVYISLFSTWRARKSWRRSPKWLS